MIENVTIVDAVGLRKFISAAAFTERVLLHIAEEMKPMGDTYSKITSVTLEQTARKQMKARAELLKEIT